MAVALASVGSVASSTTASLATAAPSGVASGDLLVLVATARDSAGGSFATPTGWTLAVASTSLSNPRAWAWTRVADGGANDTPTLTHSTTPSNGTQAAIFRLTGADTTSPVAATNSGTGGTGTTSLTIPSATATADGSLAVAAFAAATADTARTFTWPVGWTEQIDSFVSSVIRHQFSAGTIARNSGEAASGTATISTASGACGLTVMIAPAAGGGGTSIVPLVVHHMRQQGMA